MAVFVIAEAGVNHNGSLDLALRLVEAAAEAGADAVKFQSFNPERVVASSAPKAAYQLATTGSGSQLQMVRGLRLDEAAHARLSQHCAERKIEFLSTPFDDESIELLERLDVRRLKIASGDVTNLPLLWRAAASGKPIILSTGMSTLEEVSLAVGVLALRWSGGDVPSRPAFEAACAFPAGREAMQKRLTLLHCTSAYPASASEANLRAMDTLRQAFGVPVGLSDHTPGILVGVAAAARGAAVVEKHLTLDRTLSGPDHAASLEPREFRALVEGVRQVEAALGGGEKRPTEGELDLLPVARRSLVAARRIREGEHFSQENVGIKRPGTGISPVEYWEVLGQRATRDYEVDEPIEAAARERRVIQNASKA